MQNNFNFRTNYKIYSGECEIKSAILDRRLTDAIERSPLIQGGEA